MKEVVLYSLFFLIPFVSQSQSTVWTKDSRNSVYNDLLSELTPFKNITTEQKESICLCGLNDITNKYTMPDYQAKIDAELRRIKSATIGQCSKNIGVELQISQDQDVSVIKEDWNKESKSNFFNEALSQLSSYENVTQQQKENLALCFSSEITSDYTKRQISEMLEVEVKKIKTETLNKCLQKNNITLKKTEKNKLDKKSLVGCWQSYDFAICFYETGDFDKQKDKGIIKKTTKGKWFLEPDKIIFSSKDFRETYKISYYSGESLKLEEEVTKKELHFTKSFSF